MITWLLFGVGAVCAGFIQGLTGFAFGLVAMSFWVWGLSPQLAAPLVIFASIWGHLLSSFGEQKQRPQLPFRLVLPYIVAGLMGVPLGTWLLHSIDPQSFKWVLGCFLVVWSPLMLLNPQWSRLQQAGKWADGTVGFLGGILGGLGGFSGALPSAWVMLKNLTKAEQRYILRHFNFAVLVLALLSYVVQGYLGLEHLGYCIVLILAVSIPAMLGARLFYRISEQQFKIIVLGLLFIAGCLMLLSQLLNG